MMAFKINTQIAKPQKTTQNTLKKSTQNTQAQNSTSKQQNIPQRVYPNQNLLSKYNNQAAFLNTQNSLQKLSFQENLELKLKLLSF